jgi:glucose 1-dehydrogenase
VVPPGQLRRGEWRLSHITPGIVVEPADTGYEGPVWLGSDDSDYIHGGSIFVDGGRTLYPGFETGG